MTIKISTITKEACWITAVMSLVVFSRPSYSQSLTTIWKFLPSNTPITSYPTNLVQGSDGNLFGVVATASSNTAANLFKISPAGAATVTPTTPPNACGAIYFQATDGSFYGFSPQTQGLCKITPSGSALVIAAFNDGLTANDVSPKSLTSLSVIQGTDGSLYGTAFGSAISSLGMKNIVWKMSLSGNFSVLTTVPPLTAGALLGFSFVQGKDGSFYGTTNNVPDGVTIYKVTPSGVFTVLRKFTDIANLFSLVPGRDGAIYGLAAGGGSAGQGSFFRIDSDGNYSALYDFQIGFGGSLNGSTFVQASDGNFYGLQPTGGSGGYGDIFRLTPQGGFSVVYEFGPSNTAPVCLTNGSDGKLYGVTGNREAYATVFQFTPGPSSVAPPITSPTISSGGVVSATGFGGFSAIAPGTFMEIYGTNLATNTRSWAASDFIGNAAPTSLDGTSVTIAGQPAFINYISPGQINLLVPSSVQPGPQPIVITTPNGKSSSYTVTVNAVQPGLLAPPSLKLNGTQFAAALLPDGSFALPTGAIAGVASKPAKRGDTIMMYGIGFGPVVPSIPAGQVVQQANSIAGNLQITVGGIPATIPYAGLAPGFTGLYQFNIVVPNAAPGDAVPLSFTLNGATGVQTLNIAVSN